MAKIQLPDELRDHGTTSVTGVVPEIVPPSAEALAEALTLSEEILADIELSRIALTAAALKASRLARLLNDNDTMLVFRYEVSGYPTSPNGVSPEIWRLLELASRTYEVRAGDGAETDTKGLLESIEQLEQEIEVGKIRLKAAQDPDVSISSSNEYQYVQPPAGNALERQRIQIMVTTATQRVAGRRGFVHQYVSRRHYELKFSGAAQDVFSAVRESVDRTIGELVPDAIERFASVHDNLRSSNPENWSNAVHSCRRILEDLADVVFPPRSEPRVKSGREITLGRGAYVNRLVCFAEDMSGSARYTDLVGSDLHFLGDRLDAVFKAVLKGSHSSVSRQDADRFVMATYIVISDILALRQSAAEANLTPRANE